MVFGADDQNPYELLWCWDMIPALECLKRWKHGDHANKAKYKNHNMRDQNMQNTCPTRVRKVPERYPASVGKVSNNVKHVNTYHNNIRTASEQCPKNLQQVSETYPTSIAKYQTHVKTVPTTCQHMSNKVSKQCLKHFPKVSQQSPKHVQQVFQKCVYNSPTHVVGMFVAFTSLKPCFHCSEFLTHVEDDTAQNRYELLWFSELMIRITMSYYGFGR
jgi:hypothetical protein